MGLKPLLQCPHPATARPCRSGFSRDRTEPRNIGAAKASGLKPMPFNVFDAPNL